MKNSKSAKMTKHTNRNSQPGFFSSGSENFSDKERRYLNWIAFLAVLIVLSLFAAFAGRTGNLSPQFQNPETAAAQTQANNEGEAQKRLAEQYGKLPLSFERNDGQTDERVGFLSRGSGYTLFLTPTEAVLSLRKTNPEAESSVRERNSSPPVEKAVVRMTLENANPRPKIAGEEEMEGASNYITLDDSRPAVTEVPHYARVRYREVYPGVDLVYYGNQRQLEYDFIVQPGIDPKKIKLAFDGAEQMETDREGNLLLETAAGKIIQKAPVIYQEKDGARETVAGKYVIADDNRIGFEIGDYDASRELVIDPILIYSTFLGGNNEDSGNDIAVNAAGEVFITGTTTSTNFPTTYGALQTGDLDGAGKDAFVTKLNASGTARVYSTYLGGIRDQEGYGIAVDSSGSAYVTGVSGHYTPGAGDVFVAKLNSAGSALAYPVVLWGGEVPEDVPAKDVGYSIALDSGNNAYITGETNSSDFPITPNVVQPYNGFGLDGFALKVNAWGGVSYATYLGGNGAQFGRGIAVDPSGNAFIVGSSTHTDPGGDGYILKLNPTGTALVYNSWRIGGELMAEDAATDVVIDDQGNAYVTGYTDSAHLPDTPGVVQNDYAGERDAFAVKVNPAGNGFVWLTYLGTARRQEGKSIARDSAGNIYIAGVDHLNDYDSTDLNFRRTGDAFVLKLNSTASVHYYTERYGAQYARDVASAVAADAYGNAYLTGTTGSLSFRTVQAIDPKLDGPNDAFVMKVGSGSSAPNSLSSDEPVITKETAGGSKATSDENASLATFSTDLPAVSISNASMYEGNSGITNLAFIVSLSARSNRRVKITYATKDGTADSSDYGETAGTTVIYPGDLSRAIEVPIYGDTLREFDETFYVNLLEVSNGTIEDGQGEGAIVNDDTNNSRFVSQSVPENMIPGGVYEVSVTMQNTGNTTWNPTDNYRLASQTPMDNMTWGVNRVELPTRVAHGEEATFTFEIRAPEIPGTYSFHWRMVQDGIEHFGEFSERLFIDVNPRRGDLANFETDGKSNVSVHQPQIETWLLPFQRGFTNLTFGSGFLSGN